MMAFISSTPLERRVDHAWSCHRFGIRSSAWKRFVTGEHMVTMDVKSSQRVGGGDSSFSVCVWKFVSFLEYFCAEYYVW